MADSTGIDLFDETRPTTAEGLLAVAQVNGIQVIPDWSTVEYFTTWDDLKSSDLGTYFALEISEFEAAFTTKISNLVDLGIALGTRQGELPSKVQDVVYFVDKQTKQIGVACVYTIRGQDHSLGCVLIFDADYSHMRERRLVQNSPIHVIAIVQPILIMFDDTTAVNAAILEERNRLKSPRRLF